MNGREPRTVNCDEAAPDVLGWPVRAARQTLAAAGLEVQEILTSPPRGTAGTDVRVVQSHRAGARCVLTVAAFPVLAARTPQE